MNVNKLKSGIAAIALGAAISTSCDMVPPRTNAHDPANNLDRPRVTATVPAADARMVTPSQAIMAIFSEDIYGLSVNHSSFVVYDRNKAFVSGRIACDGRTVTFTPHVALDSAQTYTAVLTTNICDFALNTLEEQYEWSFRTAPHHVPETVFIEGGDYQRGSDEIMIETYPGYTAETVPERLCGPAHTVTVSGFHMGKYEVTAEEYAEYCVSTGISIPGAPFGGGKMPVVYVSWYDALKYCNWLSDYMGYDRCYSTADNIVYACDFTKNGYRLPTEAEWEYAARARGAMPGEKYSGYAGVDDIDEYAVYKGNSLSSTWLTGSKLPNALGIHDMSGNVREWCWDWNEWWLWYYEKTYTLNVLDETYYTYSSNHQPMVNPSGFTPEQEWPLTYSMRGGSFNNGAETLRTALHADHAHECFDLATQRYVDTGFRICRTATE